MDRLVQNELQSILQAWGRGSYTFQDFLNACQKEGVDIYDMNVQEPMAGKALYVFRCVPRGMSAPITLLKTFKG